MSEFAKLAQDFVEATSLLVGQRTINIMDQKGIIIASTEKHRIGDFHQGAAEVLETGKPVLIKIEDLPRYPGTKEGYNMPIFLNDEIIGVVGIFGCEEEVQSIANLLRVWRGKPERDDRKAVRYAESAAGISNPYRSAV